MSDSSDEVLKKRLAEKELADKLSAPTDFAYIQARAELGSRDVVGAGEGYYERPTVFPTSARAPIKRFCEKCGHTKYLAEFEYFLTGAQATQLGYSGNRKVKMEGHICRACRPKRKTVTALSKKELHNRAAVGDMHPMIAAAYMKKVDERKVQGIRAGLDKRWHEDLKRMWSPIVAAIAKEQHRAVQAAKYLRHPRDVKNPPSPEDAQRRIAFYDLYYDKLRALKARINLRYILNDNTKFWPLAPDGSRHPVLTKREFEEQPPRIGIELAHWASYLYTSDWLELMGAWRALGEHVHMHARTPPLQLRNSAYAPDDQ